MQALNTFRWAQDKIEEIAGTIEQHKHRETQVCERRLRQMKARQEKAAKRAEKAKAAA